MYDNTQEQIKNLLKEIDLLHKRHEHSKNIGPDYFEPGMMEYPEQSEGIFDVESGDVLIRFEVKGTRYEGRTELIERVKIGDTVKVVRDSENEYNSNNFTVLTVKGKQLGHMPATLCNVVAPLYDSEVLEFDMSEISFVDPISKRSRHAKQAVLFVELRMSLNCDRYTIT